MPTILADVIVRFDRSAVATASIDAFRASFARRVIKGRIDGFELWKVEDDAQEEVRTRLSALPGIKYAARNVSRRIQSLSPALEAGGEQWHLGQIRVTEAWDSYFPGAEPGKGVMVAVVDSGVDVRHPYLEQSIARDQDGNARFFDEIQESSLGSDAGCGPVYDWRTAYADSRHPGPDGNGHGTHVAGILAARKPGELMGVAPYASVLPVKVMDCEGNGDDWPIANGLIHAADAGAKIINLSIGGPKVGEAVLEDAIVYATSRGALLVMAAGNGFGEPVYYPAAYPGMLAVGAVDKNDQVQPYSNIGRQLSVVAPGGVTPYVTGGILSTTPTYASMMSRESGGTTWTGRATGTSQAAPQVAGIAALIWSREPNLTASQVLVRILASAKDIGTSGKDDSSGFGRVDAVEALRMTGHSF